MVESSAVPVHSTTPNGISSSTGASSSAGASASSSSDASSSAGASSSASELSSKALLSLLLPLSSSSPPQAPAIRAKAKIIERSFNKLLFLKGPPPLFQTQLLLGA